VSKGPSPPIKECMPVKAVPSAVGYNCKRTFKTSAFPGIRSSRTPLEALVEESKLHPPQNYTHALRVSELGFWVRCLPSAPPPCLYIPLSAM